jgi:osmotically-inducible protein OsmY
MGPQSLFLKRSVETMMLNSSVIAHAAHTIQFHPHLKQATVNVASEDGALVLSGTVDSFFQKQMAQESLRTVPGIRSIDNSIQVCWK